jgi:hypothetical protein
MAERAEAVPEEAPELIQFIGGASHRLFINYLRSQISQTIALQLIGYPKTPEDDAFLVGTLRRVDGHKPIFSDWRTVLPRAWLLQKNLKILANFGDILTGVLTGDLPAERLDDLPVVPAREDYIEKGLK